jgi:transcriptional regulator with GAF, ATPase, and Fis domain
LQEQKMNEGNNAPSGHSRLAALLASLRTGFAILARAIVRRRTWIALAGLLALGYAVAVLLYALSTPDIGIRCAFTPVVNSFYPEYLEPPPPVQKPLYTGDVIVSVGGDEIESWPKLLRRLTELKVDQIVTVEYRRPSEPLAPGESKSPLHRITCKVGHLPLENLLPSIAWFFLKLGLFSVGAIVFWKRPDDRSAALFFLLCIASLGAYIGGYHWSRIVTSSVLLTGFMVCSLMLPVVSLHFYLLFPRPKTWFDRWPRPILTALYGPPLVFLALMLANYWSICALDRGNVSPESTETIRSLLNWMLREIYAYFAIAVLLYLASIACLVHSYRTATDATERNQVKWILFGSLAALIPIGYTLYLALWDQSKFGSGGATWPMFFASFCVTAAFTIAITRYRLMQLDQILSSGMMYFLVSGIAGLAYYGIVFIGMLLVGSHVIDGPSFVQALWVSSTALVLMVVLDLARSRLKSALDRHFHREKRNLDRTLQQMRQAIEQLVDPPTLSRRLLETTTELLGASGGAVYLRSGEPPLYCVTHVLGSPPPLTELSSGCPLVEALQAEPTRRARPWIGPIDPAQRQLLFLGADVAHALSHEGQLLGLLLLAPRARAPYSDEDVNLLSAIVQLSVLALVSAEGHRTIEGLNRELQNKVEKIAEQQRRILFLQSQLNARSRGQESEVRSQESGVSSPGIGTNGDGTKGEDTPKTPLPDGMVGSSSQVQQLFQLVRKVAASPSAVLLRGESGTGKELLARALHENSTRAGKAFVKVHCAALAPTLLESELFGHVKGAFTNAIRDKVGRFEAAHGGTLFLDEIGDISLEVQTKLLRVLQEKSLERVGSTEPVRVDVRLIAATHQDLETLIREGRFRQDLFYRLNVISVAVPPLRARIEDIPELATHFIRLYAARAGREPLQLDDDTLALLKAYSWPGNVRELENVMERAVVIAEGSVITPDELPHEVVAGASEPREETPPDGETVEALGGLLDVDGSEAPLIFTPYPPTSGPKLSVVEYERGERERREREQLVRALAAAGGNKAEAARALGVARSTLVSRLKRLGLS